MTGPLELAELRARLNFAREAHREAVTELERLERKRNASPMALLILRRRVDTARKELVSARRRLLRSVR